MIDLVQEVSMDITDLKLDNMSYYTLQRILKRPNEKYFLQKKIVYQKENKQLKDEVGNIIRKDDVGNLSELWEDVQELHGVIQHRQDDNADYQGHESTLTYHGLFTPDFDLETDKLNNYRVKFVRDYETLYLFIKEYDANNYLRGNQNHITLIMDVDKKYFGRQQ